jgi:hypothetical protein
MKRSEIRDFVLDFLRHQGVAVEQEAPDLLRILPGGATPRKTRLLAFGQRTHRAHAEAEFVGVGSALLDQLVGDATRRGRHVVSYAALPAEEAKAPAAPETLRVPDATWRSPQRAYRPLFLFVYVAEYRTIDVPDDLELIAYDPARGEWLASCEEVLAGLERGMPGPPEGWLALSSRPTPGAICRSLSLLDKRLQRRTRKVRDAANLEIARETANIEAYYRQLIDEVRNPVGRSRLSPESEEQRVHALQLDWKRRVQEVAQFWEAGAHVRLSAVAAWMVPCWASRLRFQGGRRGGRGQGPLCQVAEYESGAFLTPRCPLCGRKLRRSVDLIGADLVCAAHAMERQLPARGDRRAVRSENE